jgi:hypothetical protein
MATLLCEDAVVEVFPQLAVLPEVNHDGGLLAGFVHDETYARDHAFSSAAFHAGHGHNPK